MSTASSKAKGLLLSFDGLDSSGKETQTRKTIERLRYLGHTVLQLQTPDYTTPSGQELKKRLQNKIGNWETTPWQDKAAFFATNRAENKNKILDALDRGHIVVYDRYLPSSLAFMVVEALRPQEADLRRQAIHDYVKALEYGTNGMPEEGASFFLDVPPRVAVDLLEKRKSKYKHEDEYTDHIHVQERLYNEYDHLCSSNPKRYIRIKCVQDGSLQSIEAINELIWEELAHRFPTLRP